MFLGHLAVGLAARRASPHASLATWFAAVQLVWLLILFLLVAYFGAAFGPPPPNVATLAWSALAMWLLIPWARWADR